MNDINPYLLALSKIDGIGPIHAKNLISYCGGIKAIFNSSKSKLLKVPGIGAKAVSQIEQVKMDQSIKDDIAILQKNKIKVISFLDDDYPKRLHHVDTSPLMLYAKGATDFNVEKTIGIVGTRKASNYAKMICEQLVEQTKTLGVTIISGLAYGIDTAAHQTAVNNNIPTIGILGHGLDQVYPASNRKLADQMLANGGLATDFGYGVKMHPKNFPARNRIIAGLSDAIIVVESGKSGGSMITAEFAHRYSKDVFAVPGDINQSRSAGCNHLIKSNKAHLLESIEDLIYIMRWDVETSKKGIQRQMFFEFDDLEQKIYNHVKSKEQIGLDDLHLDLKIPLSELNNKLLSMEFQGAIKSLPGKRYVVYK